MTTARRHVVGAPTLGGSSLALLCWWHALTPTLIPRSWQIQAVIGAVCLAAGYGIGTLLGRSVRRLLERRGRSPGPVARRVGVAVAAGWLAVVVLGSVAWVGWQNEQRASMGIARIGRLDAIPMALLSIAAAALLVIAGRAIAHVLRAVDRFKRRHLPASIVAPVAVLLIAALGIALGSRVAFRALTAAANSVYGALDESTEARVAPPDGWTDADTERLERFIGELDGESERGAH